MRQSGLLFKLTHMQKDLLIRRLFSFEDHYVTAIRPVKDGETLPFHTEEPFYPVCRCDGYWFADPMLFEYEGKTWLFLEAFDRKKQLGGVGYLCLEEPETKPRIVLREDFHMSFPYVFCWNEEVWMMPETGNDHSLRLYRAVHFPDEWQLAARIPTDVVLVDTVVTDMGPDSLTLLTSELHHERQYYYRYHRLTLTGTPEAGLVLQEDEAFLEKQEFSYRARNAGRLFPEAGKQILPTQESTPVNYGAAMNFVVYDPGETDLFANPVGRQITVSDIRTKDLFRGLVPHKLFGVHSYARTDRYEVIDLKYMVFSPLKYVRRFLNRHS